MDEDLTGTNLGSRVKGMGSSEISVISRQFEGNLGALAFVDDDLSKLKLFVLQIQTTLGIIVKVSSDNMCFSRAMVLIVSK